MEEKAGPKHSRDAQLVGYELAMLSTARKYNLANPRHRRESNAALTELFFALCEILDIDLFVEAGAHDASASRRIRTMLPGARTVAFEASPLNFELYAPDNVQAGVEYLHLALTDRPGPVTIHLHRDADGQPVANGQSSLLRRDKTPRDRERGFEAVTVEGVTLDGHLAGSEHQRPALWIDVEGACGQVLSGSAQILDRAVLLIVEVEELPYWGEGHWTRHQVSALLDQHGLVPVARDFEYPHQHNVVYLRREALSAANGALDAVALFVSRSADPGRQPPEEADPARHDDGARSAATRSGPGRTIAGRVRQTLVRRLRSLRARRR